MEAIKVCLRRSPAVTHTGERKDVQILENEIAIHFNIPQTHISESNKRSMGLGAQCITNLNYEK